MPGSQAGSLFGGHRALLLAAVICLQSASAWARPCNGALNACCFTQQPASSVVCEDVDPNQAFNFTAVFVGALSDPSMTSWQWFKTVNGVETAVPGANGTGWTAALTIQGWSPNDVGDYRCQFFESPNGDPTGGGISCGIAYSDYGSYRIEYATQIAGMPPADQTICAGDSASFSVQATNAVSYQWSKVGSNQSLQDGTLGHGTVISGTATPTLTFSNASAQDQIQGNYSCLVSGQPGCGNTTTPAAKLTIVTGAPTITSQPSPQTVCRGDTASFTVGATGQNVAYQWYKNPDSGGSIPLSDGKALGDQTVFSGTTTNTLTLSSIGTQAGGSYVCQVSNPCGTVIANATLTVTTNGVTANSITITNLASSIPDAACATSPPSSAPVSISVDTTTDMPHAPLYFQWYKRIPPAANFVAIVDGPQGTGGSSRTNITGSNNSQITLTQLHTTDTGDYGCLVSKNPAFPACSVAQSPSKTLTVTSSSPAITSNPVDQQICVGSNATFSVSASGAGTYTWYSKRATGDETPIPPGVSITPSGTIFEGADTPTLVLEHVASADMGTQYRCWVENACGRVPSAYASVSALSASAPIITTQPPASLSVCVGSVAVLSVSATGDNLTYQWRRNNVGLVNGDTYSNVNTPTLEVSIDSAFAQANFRCRVTSNLCSTASVTSSATSLSRTDPITITAQPTPLVLCGTGGTASFSVTATGADPKTYQWRKNGLAVLDGPGVSGSSTNTLTLSSVTPAAMGYYLCTVTNTCGDQSSDPAGLSVIDTSAPFTTQPTPQSVCGVGTAVFSVVAGGLPDLATTYQWQKRAAGGGFTNLSDGSGISGCLTSTLTLTGADASDATDYRCKATNTCGTFNSAVAALTMDTLATITTPPLTQTVCNGKTAVFTVQASGPNLTYRWQSRKGTQGYLNLSDGDGISGAFTNTLTLTDVNDSDAKTYRCRATNTCGTVASDPATLTVAVPVPADLDGDCDVDSSDFALFKACALGPSLPFVGNCANADLDHDGDVDMDDFAIFQRCYSGANKPADPNCAN